MALTEPDPRRPICQDIVFTSRDNLYYALSELTRLVAEAWPKMLQSAKKNMLAILADLLASRNASVEVMMLHLFRRMQSMFSETASIHRFCNLLMKTRVN